MGWHELFSESFRNFGSRLCSLCSCFVLSCLVLSCCHDLRLHAAACFGGSAVGGVGGGLGGGGGSVGRDAGVEC